MMRPLWVGAGFLFVGLAALGVALPVLPTTPFLLLASFSFAKGSERFERWLKGTTLYRTHLEGFERDRSMTLRTKVGILLPVTAMLAAAFFAMENPYGRTALIVVLGAKYYYFLVRIRTAPASVARSK